MNSNMRIYLFSAWFGMWSWSVTAQDELAPPAPTAEIGANFGQAEATPEGMEVLTSGPLHEAFADTVRYKAEPGLIIGREPPPAVEEQPPESRPEGADVVWIPGYWGWDDETNDFIWITGVYRNRPPGHRWVPGYWAPLDGQWQWVSGFWVRDEVDEVTYLPEPPDSLDQGPSSPAPSADYFWNPGCWYWRGSGYSWSAGYWARSQPGWMWYPTYYTWTPRGYVCSYGRWDRPWATRGLCFAPVRYYRPLYLNAGYYYRPWVAFNAGAFAWNLFVRPNYGHYYVGNYWGNRYNQFGYRPWYAYGNNRFGYDPFYNYYRWSNGRNNPNWDRDLRNAFARRERGDFDRPRNFNDYRARFDRIDARDRTAVTLTQLERERRGDAPRLVQESAGDSARLRDASRQFRDLNERRRETEVAGATRGPRVDRPGVEGGRGARADVAARGQLDLPPVARTRTPSPARRIDQPPIDRSGVDRAGRTAGQDRGGRTERAPREFSGQEPRGRGEAEPRGSRSFRANPDAGRGESAIPRDLDSRTRAPRPEDARVRQPSGVDRAPRSEFRAPESRRRMERAPNLRSSPDGASSRAAQEFQNRARMNAPATRSAPSTRSFESRAPRGGGEARSSRVPQGSFRQAPSGGRTRSAPNVSAPRGGGGGAPAARGGGGGGGNRGGGGGQGGGGGNRGGGQGGGGGRRGGR